MMKVAVTGASGHIGSVLCKQLIDQGAKVVALIRNRTKSIDHLPIEKVKGSVEDKNSLRKLMADCDYVIHAAGIIGLGYQFDQNIFDVNVIGTKNVLEVAKELSIKRVVHLSSIHAFQQSPYHLELDETREFVDNNVVFYDQTKRDAHLLAQDAFKGGQDVVIVCPTGVIGPSDYEPSKLGKAIWDIYNERFPLMLRGGYDFVFVNDVASGIIKALEKGIAGETYILGGQYHSLKELSETLFKIKGKAKTVRALPMIFGRIGLPFIQIYAFLSKTKPLYDNVYLDILEDGNKNINTSKAENELGYSKTELSIALKETIDWFLKHKNNIDL